MTIITENHPKWSLYSQLRKCGEITASTDGVHIGLNCSHCRCIFPWIDIKDFLQHQQKEHANLQCKVEKEKIKPKSESIEKLESTNSCLPALHEVGDADLECDESWKSSLLSEPSHASAPISFQGISIKNSPPSFDLENMDNIDSVFVKEEVCIGNNNIVDTFEVRFLSDDSSDVSTNEKVDLDTVCLNDEDYVEDKAVVKKEPAENEFMSSSDFEESDEEYASNSMENDHLLRLAEIYQRYSLLWNLDENCDKVRQMETQYKMLQEVNRTTHIKMTLNQLNVCIDLLRKYHAKDKRERDKCKQENKEFVPTKPLLFQKLQYLEPFVGPYCCEKCREEIELYRQFQAHICGTQQKKCNICLKHFKTYDSMMKHKRRHSSNEKPYSCSICGIGFNFFGELSTHQSVHTELSTPQDVPTEVSTHQDVHNGGGKQYACDMCDKAYSAKTTLNKHKERRHNPNRLRFQCTHCPKSFTEPVTLKEHINIHLERRSAVCPICGKGFFARTILRQHMRLHDNVKKFQCEFCNKEFAQKAGLYNHRRTHKPE